MAAAGISCWPRERGGSSSAAFTLDGANQRLGGHVTGLVHLRGVSEAVLEDMAIAGADRARGDAGSLRRAHPPLEIFGARLAGIYAVESRGLAITDNHGARLRQWRHPGAPLVGGRGRDADRRATG
jgi:hypothetical protein